MRLRTSGVAVFGAGSTGVLVLMLKKKAGGTVPHKFRGSNRKVYGGSAKQGSEVTTDQYGTNSLPGGALNTAGDAVKAAGGSGSL